MNYSLIYNLSSIYAIQREIKWIKFSGTCNDDWVGIWREYNNWNKVSTGREGRHMNCNDYAYNLEFRGFDDLHPGHCSGGSKICPACGCNEGYEAIFMLKFEFLG